MINKTIKAIQRRAKSYLSAILDLSPESVAILTHKLADPDAVASAFTLSRLLDYYGIKSDIFAESLKVVSKKIQSHFSIDIKSSVPSKEYSLVILVDSNNLDATGLISKYFPPNQFRFSIIDHHTPSEFLRIIPHNLAFFDASATSSSELMFFLFENSRAVKLLKSYSTILLAGILYDTNRFSFINNRVFYVAQSLINNGADYLFAQSLIERDVSYSEKIAKLKGAQRLKLYRIGHWIISFTSVNSYGGVICNALLNLGADVAAVCSVRNNYIILTVRATQHFYNETKIDLAEDVISILKRSFDATGGGHSTAAVINIFSQDIYCDKVFLELLSILEQRLGACARNV
ncbi:MAG: DHH family phosphoesterase [Candidatus Asgardarchaeia archaeon]